MKKGIIILVLLAVSIISSYAQQHVQCCINLGGPWSPWFPTSSRMYASNNGITITEGGIDGVQFVVYPGQYQGKEGKYKIYKATVQYYVSDNYPTFESVLRRFMFPVYTRRDTYARPVTSEATIKIRKSIFRYILTAYFDGIAISFCV